MTPPDGPAGSCGSHEPVPPQGLGAPAGIKDIFQMFLDWYYIEYDSSLPKRVCLMNHLKTSVKLSRRIIFIKNLSVAAKA